MRILHTADWHLGKRLDNFSRLDEQVLVMDEIVEKADLYQTDLVIVAGDLFDTFHPGTEAIDLFYKTLKRLAKGGARPVIAISGNHDSPALIDAPDPLARECGIILIGHPQAVVNPIKLPDFEITQSAPGVIEIKLNRFSYPIRIIHTAYANELRLKQYLGEDKSEALNTVLAKHWKDIADTYCDANGVNILAAHLYMNKRGTPLLEEPEGEKPIKIGNADLIYTDCIPPQIQYTALGHIHRYFPVESTEKPVIYSSSPLSYSFSEAGQTKYIVLVDAVPNQPVHHEKIALERGRTLHRKTFHDTEQALTWLQENPYTLVELTLVSDTFLKAEERNLLYKAHDGIIHLIPVITNKEEKQDSSTVINLDQDIKSLFKDYFKSKNNQLEPNNEIMDIFNEIVHKV
ncbi:exonuclease subunit SbcD [Parapedobacter sp. SGR-10]|uniref:metallophosphoesterase family protein n=1 Tax=Parapedobacter sp. SGR-10 TaxID=2710879 RepID=UPI0013D2146E|nr:exonuclease subunit SbcD [Parapedobacter sp. SGR-10]NGF55771.1 exonuclease subunit SbcD [Parapedobacter sp. SGR-10]